MSEASVPASAGPGGGAQNAWADVSAEPDPRRWLILIVIAIAQLMVVLDSTVMNIALPSAQNALHFTDVDRQWVVTAYSLSFGSLLLFGGRLADLVGRRLMFITGLAGFAIASAIGGASVNFTMLVSARAAQGVFAAMLAPAALSLLATTFTNPKERGKAFGIYGSVAAGVGVGTVYRRFPDKESLIEELFRDRIDAMVKLAEEALTEPDPWQAFVSYLEMATEIMAANTGLRQLLMFATYGKDRICYARDQMRPVVSKLVERAQASGDLRPDFDASDVKLTCSPRRPTTPPPPSPRSGDATWRCSSTGSGPPATP
jgi:hypothetical protein